MDNSIYRSHLRPDREYLGFHSLPLLESSAARRRREEERRRARAFAAGAASTFFAVVAMAILL